MAKKRVHEIAKEQGIPSKELMERLRAAGVDVKTAASSVDESLRAARARHREHGSRHSRRRCAGRCPDGGAPRAGRRRVACRHGHRRARGAERSGRLPRPARSRRRPRRNRAPTTPVPVAAEAAPAEGATATAVAPGGAADAQGERVRPTRDSRTGERAPAAPAREAAAGS